MLQDIQSEVCSNILSHKTDVDMVIISVQTSCMHIDQDAYLLVLGQSVILVTSGLISCLPKVELQMKHFIAVYSSYV